MKDTHLCPVHRQSRTKAGGRSAVSASWVQPSRVSSGVVIAVVVGLLASAAAADSSIPSSSSEAGLTLTYVANAGFLVEADGVRVLIDGMMEQSFPPYVRLPREARRAMTEGAPPFDDLDLILATHIHGDHFEASAVASYLRSHAETRFVSTPQAVGELSRRQGFADFRSRVRGSIPVEGERIDLSALGLDLPDGLGGELLYLHHGRGRSVQNLGFLLQISGWTLLHIGDTEAVRSMARYGLPTEQIDVAFVPDWYFRAAPWKGKVPELIGACRHVVMHLPPEWWTIRRHQNGVDEARSLDPESIVFREIGDKVTLEAGCR